MAKVPARQPRGKKVVKGYRKIRASDLPPDQQAKFREAMIADLTKTITSQIKNDVKEVDLAKVELILRPGQKVGDPGDTQMICCTCGTCNCGTCGANTAMPDDIPIGVIRELGISVETLPSSISIRERMARLENLVEKKKIR